jgi:small subunit ribosomal protein S16
MDIRSPRDGRVIEELGWYDPEAKDPEKQVSLNRERIEYWLGVGAQPSDTVRNLLKRQGIPAASP